MKQKVYVGMSGGVDSSLAAAVLKEEGYDVTGVYMKNWSQDIAGFHCPWRDDLTDAKRVAVQLGIDFKMYDFEDEYKEKIVDYMVDAYKQGLTPNPDIMCNQDIKFKMFLETALADGADMIATGHYARTRDGQLLKAVDDNKDQTYFLYRVTQDALKKSLFPLGRLKKSDVRKMAAERGLITAEKKESMGICFVGKIGIKDFLKNYVNTEPGAILSEAGKQIGEHDGAIFYTIGQRHGLDVGGGLPYYVIDKDIEANTVTVSSDIDNENLWRSDVILTRPHWINQPPTEGEKLDARVRHRGELISATVTGIEESKFSIKLERALRAVTPGQSIVLYDDERVAGGGIVSK